MDRNHRTTFEGVVTSAKMDKTIVVTVSTKRSASLYHKRVGYSKKFVAHDEHNEAHVGDTVMIMACRPMSKTKRFRLVKVLKQSVSAESAEQVEKELEAAEGSAEEVAPEAKEPEQAEPAAKEEPKEAEPAPEAEKKEGE
jgi:small subunit ribosomal protein S17